MKYNPGKIEKKWQKEWEKEKLHETLDQIKDKKNFFLLTEFSYPSGNLHIGHWYAYSIPDIMARYLRMSGLNVLYPTGFDAFGLPAENAAIKNNLQPKDYTDENMASMRKQLRSMGTTFDWSREVVTADPDYYKWTQWMFLQFYKAGLVYRAKTTVNWCPKDQTVLANEQVINGRCYRCDSEVVQKELTQWMVAITKYADRLIDDLDKVDYLDNVKLSQRNWIGRSQGAEINFVMEDGKNSVKVFTTRPDTIFGATFLVIAPETAQKWIVDGWNADTEVKKYIETSSHKTELERQEQVKDKTGVFGGVYAINPANKEKIPVWIADYVLGSYGTGAIMAVPAHDKRDLEFAQKFDLPVISVVEEGKLTNSMQFDGLGCEEAKSKIIEFVGGTEKTTYRLRDWGLSRQRYWGTPIPMIHCEKCGYQPVPEKDLPVLLPRLEDYKPSSDGRSPLAKATDWLKVKCPECGADAQRETDTMDTFVDSSWYFMRYADPKNKKYFADKEQMAKWLPVDFYSGGAEHTTMHLLYSRFWTKAMYDLSLISFDEPYKKRRNRGLILGPDGQKMSKSRGNVIDPDEQVEKYGADTVRMFLAFLGPYEQGAPWDPKGINGISRFINRVWIASGSEFSEISNEKTEKSLNYSIKKIGEDINDLKFNTAISEMMKVLNQVESTGVTKEQFQKFLMTLAPFAPHITEEIWQTTLKNKKSIHLEKWPEYDPDLIKEETSNLPVQINSKVRDVIVIDADASEDEVKELALASENVKKYINSSPIKKTVYVKGKILNIII